ncbi:mycothiol system anti-sigma-R factor [Microlunatus sp. Gsoil 973]|jgi:anti-sigma factor (TIGR02949 family)|uniref:mycothiol system anti-sigma-R factor n=1 Tax=Microlunatus sp. Gsoil 973 TaxID=2672569 RepID=UPI0012B46E87|nr:mycothiol system anti-sigma-R factor [Microlunatus sp. Gsoil 973]QGN32273.1 mycothiol system anti-sigma-R factor [Microlunatus sp. Gsoil 973]
MTGHGESETDCDRAISRLYQFLDHELGSADEDQIREHLAACEPCLDTFDAEAALKKLIKRGCSGEVAPEHLRARIHAVITTSTTVEIRES